jgi:hypothetical protein
MTQFSGKDAEYECVLYASFRLLRPANVDEKKLFALILTLLTYRKGKYAATCIPQLFR